MRHGWTKKVLWFRECNKQCWCVLPALTEFLRSYRESMVSISPRTSPPARLLLRPLLFISTRNDVLSPELAHLISRRQYCTSYRDWNIISLVQAFKLPSWLFLCHTQFNWFGHFWRCKSIWQEHSLLSWSKLFHCQNSPHNKKISGCQQGQSDHMLAIK